MSEKGKRLIRLSQTKWLADVGVSRTITTEINCKTAFQQRVTLNVQKSSNLRGFQFKHIHRRLSTNGSFMRIRLVDSDKGIQANLKHKHVSTFSGEVQKLVVSVTYSSPRYDHLKSIEIRLLKQCRLLQICV